MDDIKKKIIFWCDLLIEFGFIVFILVAPIKDHTATIKSLGIALPFAAWLIKMILSKKVSWVKTSLDIPFLIFIVISILSVFFSVHVPESLRALKNFLLKFVLIYFTLTNNIKSPGQIKRMAGAFVTISVFISLLAIYNYFFKPGIPGSVGAAALSLNHIGLAKFLVVLSPVIFVFYSLSKKKLSTFFSSLFFFISLLGIIISYSRGGWIVFFCSTFFWAFFKDRKTIIPAIFICFSLLFFASPTQLKNRIETGLKKGALQNRPAYWQAGWDMIKDKPFLGFGYSVRIYKKIYPEYKPDNALDELPRHVHSTYLAAAIESGVLGIFSLLAIFSIYFYSVFKAILNTKKEPHRTLLIGFLCSLTAYLIFGLVEPMLIDQEGMYFWIMAACSMTLLNFLNTHESN